MVPREGGIRKEGDEKRIKMCCVYVRTHKQCNYYVLTHVPNIFKLQNNQTSFD